MSVTLPHPKTIFTAAVDRAIERYGSAEQPNITVEQLADIVGFNDQEKKFAAMSWSLIYTNEWIYLSDEIILTQLTMETGKGAINNFTTRELLVPEYIYGHSYARILPNGDILDEQGKPTTEFDINFSSSKLRNYIKGHGKRYFIVSPECMKSLLLRASTRRGSETRGYFVKLEKLAAVMREYMMRKDEIRRDRAIEDERRAHQLAIEYERSEVEKAKMKLEETMRKACQTEEDMRLRAICIKEMKFPLEPMKPDGYLYIMTSPIYAKKHIYKIGRTSTSMHQRIAGYETGRTSDDKMKCLYSRECFATKETEEFIKGTLAPYLEDRSKPKSEMFVMKFEVLRTVLDICIDNSARFCESVNDYWARKDEVADSIRKEDEVGSSPAPSTMALMPPPDTGADREMPHRTLSSPRATATATTTTTMVTTTVCEQDAHNNEMHEQGANGATNSAIFEQLARIQELVQRNGEILAPDVNIAALVTEIHANPAIMFALKISMATNEYIIIKRAIRLFNVDVDMCAECSRCERKKHIGHRRAHIIRKETPGAKIPPPSRDPQGFADLSETTPSTVTSAMSSISTQSVPVIIIDTKKKRGRKSKTLSNPVISTHLDHIREILLHNGELISPADDIDAIISIVRNDPAIMTALDLTLKSREYIIMKRVIKIMNMKNEISCTESTRSQIGEHRRVRLLRPC